MESDQQKNEAREQALRDVKLYLANDWVLKEETPQYFLLTRRKSSVMVHLILFLFTLGIGNIIYYFVSEEKKKIFK